MLKINDDNIYVGQIKQILKNFNLPKARIYNSEEPLASGLHYIKNNSIYYCDSDNNLNYICAYTYDKEYTNLTTNLKINNNIYDLYTHKYLGKYLRFLKDYNNLDLMSMYNCFNGEQITNISLEVELNPTTKETSITRGFNYKDSSYNVFCVPLRFGQYYTIGVNCQIPIEVVACFYKDGKLIKTKDDETMYSETYQRVRNCSLNRPLVYDKLIKYTPSASQIRNEGCLCLLIKIPTSCDSSIVVLEGDFTSDSQKIYDKRNELVGRFIKYCQSHQSWSGDEHSGESIETIDTKPTWGGVYNYTSRLELLGYPNSKGNYLVATRLKEYLSGNAITQMSEGYDIKKLQKVLIQRGYLDKAYLGMWDKEREALARFINDKGINNEKYDVIGYLDKDVEYTLGGII